MTWVFLTFFALGICCIALGWSARRGAGPVAAYRRDVIGSLGLDAPDRMLVLGIPSLGAMALAIATAIIGFTYCPDSFKPLIAFFVVVMIALGLIGFLWAALWFLALPKSLRGSSPRADSGAFEVQPDGSKRLTGVRPLAPLVVVAAFLGFSLWMATMPMPGIVIAAVLGIAGLGILVSQVPMLLRGASLQLNDEGITMLTSFSPVSIPWEAVDRIEADVMSATLVVDNEALTTLTGKAREQAAKRGRISVPSHSLRMTPDRLATELEAAWREARHSSRTDG